MFPKTFLKSILLLFLLFTFSSEVYGSKPMLSSVSVPFVKNGGQMNRKVSFYARLFNGDLFVTKKGEMVYSFSSKAKGRFVIKEIISNLTPEVKGLKRVDAKVTYVKGNKIFTELPAYETVFLGAIDKGIRVHLNAYGSMEEFI